MGEYHCVQRVAYTSVAVFPWKLCIFFRCQCFACHPNRIPKMWSGATCATAIQSCDRPNMKGVVVIVFDIIIDCEKLPCIVMSNLFFLTKWKASEMFNGILRWNSFELRCAHIVFVLRIMFFSSGKNLDFTGWRSWTTFVNHCDIVSKKAFCCFRAWNLCGVDPYVL